MHAIAGDTRENMSVLETRTGQEFRFVLPGPRWTTHAISSPAVEALLPTAEPVQPARWIIASGSLPPECRTTFMRNWPTQPNSKEHLLRSTPRAPRWRQRWKVGVALVKPSLRELRDLLQRPLNTVQNAVTPPSPWCSKALPARWPFRWVSKAPCWPTATAYGTHQRLRCQPPPAPRGGRLLLAALVWALEHGDTPPEALRWGVAAGTAALLSPGTALAQAADIHRLHAQVPVPQAITVAR